MTIKEILESKKLLLSFELFPPKKEQGFEGVFEATEKLSFLRPDFISVTCGAGGTTGGNTSQVAAKIKSMGIPPLAHLTCIDNTRESLMQKIQEMKGLGIKNVLALRGDKKIDSSDFKQAFEHASDIVPLLKQAGFCTGGACYPEGHPESPCLDADIDNLHYKVDAGVDFLTTQMFFDNNMLYSYLYRLNSKGIHLPVLAGIMPVTNASQVQKMVRLSGAHVPPKLAMLCDKFSSNREAMYQAGISYAVDQILDLISNGIRGIHIYTMNKANVACDILKNLNSVFEAAA